MSEDSTGERAPSERPPDTDPETDPEDPPDMGDLFDELEALEAVADTPEERERV
jgi:hypothetical protein